MLFTILQMLIKAQQAISLVMIFLGRGIGGPRIAVSQPWQILDPANFLGDPTVQCLNVAV